ncbi:MAG: hypothetical protein K2H23_02245, partial [Oscillospiraceae bacterium]|nr:hypothetical protein [Oscillospiraceae bacterium]
MMRRRNKPGLRGIAALAVFIMLLPLMAAAVSNAMPSAESAFFFAASASAALSVGDIFKNYDNPSEQDNADKSSAETEAVQTAKAAFFTIDDSNMISYGAPEIPNSTDEEKIVTNDSYDV